MKKNNILLIIPLIIVLCLIIIYFLYPSIRNFKDIIDFNPDKTKENIIQSFYANENDYKKVVKELSEYDYDDIEITNMLFAVKVRYDFRKNKFVINKIGTDYKNYQKSIKMINDLNLVSIERYNKDSEFVLFVHYLRAGYGQNIIYTDNLKNYEKYGYEISVAEKLSDNWYYIEER